MSPLRRSLLAIVLTATPFLSAMAQDKKELVFGATAGPYADQIKLGIKPLLEKKGYRVKVVEFNDYVQPNHALAQGDLAEIARVAVPRQVCSNQPIAVQQVRFVASALGGDAGLYGAARLAMVTT